jgi:hypothetical protein
MSDVTPLLSGIEFGGEKCVCIRGAGPRHAPAHEALPARLSDATFAEINILIDSRHFIADVWGPFGGRDLRRLAAGPPGALAPANDTSGASGFNSSRQF